MILKIVIIAIICIFLSSVIKQYNSEIASIISVCGGVIVFIFVCDEMKGVIDFLLSMNDFVSINSDVLKMLIKVVGVGYITEFTADIAEDFGNKVIASKVLLGGKVVVCAMTIPVIKELLSMLFAFLS